MLSGKRESHYSQNMLVLVSFELDISLVQSSCGYAVPFYEYQGERSTLRKWADNKGSEAVEQYWEEKNLKSLDGKETGML